MEEKDLQKLDELLNLKDDSGLFLYNKIEKVETELEAEILISQAYLEDEIASVDEKIPKIEDILTTVKDNLSLKGDTGEKGEKGDKGDSIVGPQGPIGPAGESIQGDTAFAIDLLAPTFFTAAVGGGAVVGPVFFNGASWICT